MLRSLIKLQQSQAIKDLLNLLIAQVRLLSHLRLIYGEIRRKMAEIANLIRNRKEETHLTRINRWRMFNLRRARMRIKKMVNRKNLRFLVKVQVKAQSTVTNLNFKKKKNTLILLMLIQCANNQDSHKSKKLPVKSQMILKSHQMELQ